MLRIEPASSLLPERVAALGDPDCHDSGTLLKLPLALSALPGTAAVSPLSSLVTVSVGICIYVRRYKHV